LDSSANIAYSSKEETHMDEDKRCLASAAPGEVPIAPLILIYQRQKIATSVYQQLKDKIN
jgi:hypothetical protein